MPSGIRGRVSRAANAKLAVLIVTNFVDMVGLLMIIPLMPFYARELGGVYLALDQHQFTDQMTAGRGFIAISAVIFGRWDPIRAALACLLFAAAETFQIQLQGSHAIPSQFVEMIPYLLTIIALAGVVGRAVPPAALGRAQN